jgi:glycosyltransferase involved in cell wall biosynthesis
LGEVENKELNKFLSMGDVFIQPTLGNEAFGITIIEAMACELPVVASKNGGILDIIKDGKNGYLFEINNIDEMKEKIKYAFNSKIDSRKYVINNFTWKKTVDKLLSHIKD